MNNKINENTGAEKIIINNVSLTKSRIILRGTSIRGSAIKNIMHIKSFELCLNLLVYLLR